MTHPTPQAAIYYNPEANRYGFKVWMPGKRPHDMMECFDTPEAARNWIDPQDERVWGEPEPGDPLLILISRGYKPGSVPTRA